MRGVSGATEHMSTPAVGAWGLSTIVSVAFTCLLFHPIEVRPRHSKRLPDGFRSGSLGADCWPRPTYGRAAYGLLSR
jgi:hypothetical protein